MPGHVWWRGDACNYKRKCAQIAATVDTGEARDQNIEDSWRAFCVFAGPAAVERGKAYKVHYLGPPRCVGIGLGHNHMHAQCALPQTRLL